MSYLLDTHRHAVGTDGPGTPRAHSARGHREPLVAFGRLRGVGVRNRHEAPTGKLPQADVLLGAYSKHLDRLGVIRLPVDEDHALLAAWSGTTAIRSTVCSRRRR